MIYLLIFIVVCFNFFVFGRSTRGFFLCCYHRTYTKHLTINTMYSWICMFIPSQDFSVRISLNFLPLFSFSLLYMCSHNSIYEGLMVFHMFLIFSSLFLISFYISNAISNGGLSWSLPFFSSSWSNLVLKLSIEYLDLSLHSLTLEFLCGSFLWFMVYIS